MKESIVATEIKPRELYISLVFFSIKKFYALFCELGSGKYLAFRQLWGMKCFEQKGGGGIGQKKIIK